MLDNKLFTSNYHNTGRRSFKLHEDNYNLKGIEPSIFKSIEQDTLKNTNMLHIKYKNVLWRE